MVAVVVCSLLMVSCSGMRYWAEELVAGIFGTEEVEYNQSQEQIVEMASTELLVAEPVEAVAEPVEAVVEKAGQVESNTGATRVEANSDLEQMAVYYANEAAAAMQSGNETKVEQISKKVEDYYMNLSYENQQKFDTLFETAFQASMNAVVEAASATAVEAAMPYAEENVATAVEAAAQFAEEAIATAVEAAGDSYTF